MKHLKEKLKAIWMILKSDGFDVATTYPTKRGYFFWSVSVFGRNNSANLLHNRIGNLFSSIEWVIEDANKRKERKEELYRDEKDMQVPDDTVQSD